MSRFQLPCITRRLLSYCDNVILSSIIIIRIGVYLCHFAGALLQHVVDAAIANGLRGLETMTGIPGWVGGALYGNAGAYGRSVHELVQSVRFFNGARVCEIDNKKNVRAVVPDVAGDDGRAFQPLIGILRRGHLHAAGGADPRREFGGSRELAGGVIQAVDADRVVRGCRNEVRAI